MEAKKDNKMLFRIGAVVLSLILVAAVLAVIFFWPSQPREQEQASEEVVLAVPEPNQEELVEEDGPETEAQVDPNLEDTEEVGAVTEEPQTTSDTKPETGSTASAQTASGDKQGQYSQTSSQTSGSKPTSTSSQTSGNKTTASTTQSSNVTTSAQTPESVTKPEKNTSVVYEPVGAKPTSSSDNKLIVQTTSGAPKPVSGKSYVSARFNKSGSYSESKVYKNGYIDAGNVTISNKTFTGDLYIDVPSGTVTLKNVDVQGTIRLTDGSDWVKLYDVNAGALTIDNKDISRVFASRDTAVNAVNVKSSAVLEEGGLFTNSVGFRDVTVNAAKGSSLTLRNLNLNKLRTNTACDVVYDGNTIINYVYTYAPTELYGNGQINRLYCNSNGVYYDTKPLYIQTGKGYATPSRRSSGSGSGSSTDDKKVTLHDISDQYLNIGDTHIVAIDHNGSSLRVTTNNPSVAKVTYSTSKSRITMTGLKAGKATIKITSSRSGYTSSTISFNIIVKESGSTSIQLSGISNQTMDKGNTRYITVNTNASRISVTNSNTNVADVTTDGFQLRIRAKASGTTTVKVTASRTGYTSKTTSFKVIVREPSSGSDSVSINRIDSQIMNKGSQRVVNVRTDGTSLKAVSNNEKIAKVRVSGDDALIIEAVSPGSATITVVASRRGYTSATTAFRVDVYGDTISAPTVYMNYPNGSSYPNGSWTNQDIKFILTGYSSNRTAYSYERPAGGSSSQWGTRRELPNGTLTITAEGEKDYYFFTRGTGGDSVATSIYTVRIDKTKPVIDVKSNTGNTLTFTVSDALSGIKTVRILDKNNTAYYPTHSGGRYTFTAQTAGDYRVEAVDHAGNIQLSGYFTLSGQTQPDAQRPVITFKIKPEDKWYREEQKVSFTVTDNVGIKNVSVDPTMTHSQASDGTYTFTAAQEGNITYTITATDTSNNTQTEKVTVKLDKTKPTISEVSIADKTESSATRLVTVTATDTTSGIQTIKAVEEGKSDSIVVSGSNGTYTFTATEGKKYTITAVDNAGNESVSQIINVETPVQPIEPAVSISDVTVSDENTMTKSKTLSFKVNATLGENQSLHVSVTDAQGKQQPAANALGVQTNYSVLLTANGTYTITASVVENDVVKATTTEKKEVTNIDRAEPDIQVIESSNGTLKFTVVDENLKEVKLNNEVLTASSGNTYEKTGLTAGEYTIVATDEAGNTAERKATVTLLQQPTVTAHATNLDSTDHQKAETIITVDAHGSKLKEPTVNVTGATVTKQSETIYLFSATENGTYTVTFAAENGTESKVELTVTGIQKDQLPPTIQTGEPTTNAAANAATVAITVTDPDDPSAAVKLTSDKGALTGSDNAYTLTATENGKYTLTATDESGKTSTYTVTIDSIKANIAPSITAEPVNVNGKTGTVKLIVNDNGGAAITSVADQNGAQAIPQSDGSYLLTVTDNTTYTVTVTNAAGLTAQANVVVTGLDLSAPIIAAPQVSFNENKTGAEITWTVTDLVDGTQGSGVASVTFAGNVMTSNSNGVYVASVTDNGDYIITAVDNAGNSTNQTVPVTGIDKIAPTIRTTSDNSAWKKAHTVTFVVNDENSGVAPSVSVTRDGVAVNCVESEKGYSFTADQNGTYIISASDKAGNAATPVSVVITKVDTTAPAAPKLMKGDKKVAAYNAQTGKGIYDTDTKATFTVSYQKAAEGQSPVSVKMKLDDAKEFTTLTDQTMKLTLKAGKHTVVLKTVDAAGNESQPVTYVFKVTDASAAAQPASENKEDASTQTDPPVQDASTQTPTSSDPQPTEE